MIDKQIIRELLSKRGFSQEKLADKMSKKQTNITGYLNRGKKGMRLDIFVEIVEALGCKVIVQDIKNPELIWQVDYRIGDEEGQ